MRRETLRYDTKAPRICVVGAGVVGVATGRGFALAGAEVSFVDISEERVAQLVHEGSDAHGIDSLASLRADHYLISVPTPTRGGRVDLGAISSASREIGQAIAARDEWSCVVVRSTVPPGTTDDLVRTILEESSGKCAGEGFGLAMNPEFLREATAAEDFLRPRVIVVGAPEERTETAMRWLYEPWAEVDTLLMPTRAAEATKYTANLFNAAKISFFNELHGFFESLGVDSTVAFDAAVRGAEGLWNPRYGTRGGAPFGGACLPKDTEAFLGFAEDHGVDLAILASVVAYNERLGATQLPSARRSR